jgi:hypothetical protein
MKRNKGQENLFVPLIKYRVTTTYGGMKVYLGTIFQNLCREEFSTVKLSEERKSISYKIIHDIVSTNDG